MYDSQTMYHYTIIASVSLYYFSQAKGITILYGLLLLVCIRIQ